MDHLPSELLDDTLKRACSDGGQTGCALAAVSRYIWDSSTPMRYHSIALRGARQIRSFLKLLGTIEEHMSSPTLSNERTWMAQLKWNQVNRWHVHSEALPNPIVQVQHLLFTGCAKDILSYSSSDLPMWTQWVDNTQTKTFSSLRSRSLDEMGGPSRGIW
jgi:hypothetical protein